MNVKTKESSVEEGREYGGNEALALFCREIAKTKLLTKEEEIKLSKLVSTGDDDARTHMIVANLRLVVSIAHGFVNYGLPLLDLISEGCIGLMNAVDRFDPKKGVRFSTYAGIWIRQAMTKSLNKMSRTIRLPAGILDKASKARRAVAGLIQQGNHEPTVQDIAKESGLTICLINFLKNASKSTVSIHHILGDGESDSGQTLSDMIPDESAEDPRDFCDLSIMRGILYEELAKLGTRDRMMLDSRYGLSTGKEKTLEEVGNGIKLTRERIRQKEVKLLVTLRRRINQRSKESQPN